MSAVQVLLIVEAKGLGDREIFDTYLAKEGFLPIPDETFSYTGETSTPRLNTVLYIFDTVEQGIKKSGFDSCKIIFQIGEYAMEGYKYDKNKKKFIGVEI